jgi:hypothetical protein
VERIFLAMAARREKFPDTIHTILKSALAAAAPEDRPPVASLHLGAQVRPVCPAVGQVAIAMELAERFATGAERKRVTAVLAAVRRYLDGKDVGKGLRALSEVKSEGAEAIARNAAGAAATLARGKPDLVHTGAQAAAARAVVLAGPGEPTRRLLEALDQEVLRWECDAAFDGANHAPVERVLWRGADSGKTVHFVARLQGGRAASRVKLVRGKPSAYTEGTLEEVLALVPEAHFADAVKTAMAQNARQTTLIKSLP